MNDKLLLIDKPAGITSHDTVDHIRRLYKTRRVGHAGTLDPFATGLLIVGVGKATKQLTGLVGLDKTYIAELTLGAASTTFDPEGVITPCSPIRPPNRPDIERALDKFRGEYDQRAPLYSAKKIRGQKLYDLARAGKATEDMRPIKRVCIPELSILAYDFPTLRLHVACSSGTYIRSLADDIGHTLGCGAYLSTLRRTRIGHYLIQDAHTLAELPFIDDSRARCKTQFSVIARSEATRQSLFL